MVRLFRGCVHARASSPGIGTLRIVSPWVFKPLLSGLTWNEAQAALQAASRRHPAIALSVRAVEGEDPGSEKPIYELGVDAEDFDRYPDVIDAIIARLQPLRFRLAEVEKTLATLVGEMLASPPPMPDAPAQELCTLLEWVIVPHLLELGDFVDGFDASTIRPLPRGVALAGRCWCFSGRGHLDTDFEAELALADNGSLSHFELAFGDPRTIRAASTFGPIPDFAERVVGGYRVEIHSGAQSEPQPRWAFRINKLW